MRNSQENEDNFVPSKRENSILLKPFTPGLNQKSNHYNQDKFYCFAVHKKSAKRLLKVQKKYHRQTYSPTSLNRADSCKFGHDGVI